MTLQLMSTHDRRDIGSSFEMIPERIVDRMVVQPLRECVQHRWWAALRVGRRPVVDLRIERVRDEVPTRSPSCEQLTLCVEPTAIRVERDRREPREHDRAVFDDVLEQLAPETAAEEGGTHTGDTSEPRSLPRQVDALHDHPVEVVDALDVGDEFLEVVDLTHAAERTTSPSPSHRRRTVQDSTSPLGRASNAATVRRSTDPAAP
jgi:hypothetical protein